jgi:uncharacterized membrane protein
MDVEEKIRHFSKEEEDSPPLVKLRAFFVTGLLVIGPIFITIWITIKLFLFADGFIGRPIQYLLGDVIGIPFFQEHMVHGIGVVALLLIIIAAGWFARQYLGGRLMKMVNTIMDRVPLVNKVYAAIVQISEALLGGQKEVFKYAVIIEYPKEDVFSIGFVTQDTKGSVQDSIEDDVISVFIPTTPNPTSGYLLFVPKKDVTFLDLSVEESLKLIISAGAVIPRRGGGSAEAARRLGIRIAPAKTEGD